MSPAVAAGLASTVVFALSTLPMVARAIQTKEMASYSRGHLVMTNIGNAIHTAYVVSLPSARSGSCTPSTWWCRPRCSPGTCATPENLRREVPSLWPRRG